MDFRDRGCEDEHWIELAQAYAQWQTLALAVLDSKDRTLGNWNYYNRLYRT
jgi:hypothetical protein